MNTRRVPARPVAGRHAISTGVAALVPDNDGRRGWTLYVNGMESSHVDLDDPTRLDFEYLRWFAAGLESMPHLASSGVEGHDGTDARIVHLGGGGCTFAMYVAAQFPQARQLVVELDSEVLELAKNAFGLRSRSRLRLRAAEARTAVAALDDDGAEILIRDAFTGSQVPGHLTTVEFLRDVDRVLTPHGVYLANLADGNGLAAARREAATALAVFPHVVVIAEPGQFRGRRYGNVVIAGSRAELPIPAWSRRLASDPVRARLLDTAATRDFASGRVVLHDAEVADPSWSTTSTTPDGDRLAPSQS